MKKSEIVFLIAAIALSAAMISSVSTQMALADETQEKVDSKHEKVEQEKFGFTSHKDVKFHEKHGFPNNEALGDLSCQEGKKDNLASYGC